MNDKNKEYLITLMIHALKSIEENYTLLEKHAFIVVKEVNNFKVYIFEQQVTMLIPYPAIKSILIQMELGILIGS